MTAESVNFKKTRGFGRRQEEDDNKYEDNEYIQSFHSNIEKLHLMFQKLEEQFQICLRLQNSVLEHRDPKYQDELSHVYEDIRKKAKHALDSLAEMKEHFERKEHKMNETVKQVCILQLSGLQSFITKFIVEYQRTQADFKSKCKEKIRRHMSIVANITYEDNEPRFNEKMSFLQMVIPDINIAEKIINEIQARHDALLILEEHVRKLHEIFMEVAFMLECQGWKLQGIQEAVEFAREAVTHGAVDIKIACHRERHTKWCCTVACVAIVITSIIIAVTTSYQKWG